MWMTEQEAREIMHACGWSYLLRPRGKRTYVYAARKEQGQRKEVYVSPLASLESLTVEKLKSLLSCTS
jgi:ORF D-335-like protein